MSTFTDALVIIGLFALRIGIPVAVIALLAYGLKRLDRRWEEEARAQTTAARRVVQPIEQPVQRLEAPEPVSQSSSMPDIAVQQTPVDLTQASSRELVGKVNGKGRS